MVKNEHGFTLPELLAVIIITSIIIVPLMFTMIENVKINTLLHVRRSSVSIADGVMSGFDKLDYLDIEAVQGTQSQHFTEYNSTNCTQLSNPDDVAICGALFDLTFNNNNFDEAHYRVFIYDYNINLATQNALKINSNLPVEVQEVIGALSVSTDPNPGLLRITVWIKYSDDPVRTTVVSGLLIGDWTSANYD